MQFTSFTCNICGKCRETDALSGAYTIIWVEFSICNLICLSRIIALGFLQDLRSCGKPSNGGPTIDVCPVCRVSLAIL